MKLIRDLAELPLALRSGAVAIGNFDGVHLGHARIVERLVATARQLGGAAVAFTFDPHPATLLRPGAAPPAVTTTSRKAELLAGLGVDAVVAYPTSKQFLALSAREFFDQIVRARLDARAMIEGQNFFFGRDREGGVQLLQQFCEQAGLRLEVVEPVMVAGAAVSSSRVREALSAGALQQANAMLTRPYRIRGTVVRGAQRGAGLGFPTANLDQVETLLPAPGVYAARGQTVDGAWPAAVSIGPNTTFGEHALKVEAYLIGFQGDLYGQPLDIDFLERLRDIERFENVAALVAQLHLDVEQTARIAAEFDQT